MNYFVVNDTGYHETNEGPIHINYFVVNDIGYREEMKKAYTYIILRLKVSVTAKQMKDTCT